MTDYDEDAFWYTFEEDPVYDADDFNLFDPMPREEVEAIHQRELERTLLEALVYGMGNMAPKLLQNGWLLDFTNGTYEPRYEVPNDTRWLGVPPPVTVTRPVRAEDYAWMHLLYGSSVTPIEEATWTLTQAWADNPPAPPTPWRSQYHIPAGTPLHRYEDSHDWMPW